MMRRSACPASDRILRLVFGEVMVGDRRALRPMTAGKSRRELAAAVCSRRCFSGSAVFGKRRRCPTSQVWSAGPIAGCAKRSARSPFRTDHLQNHPGHHANSKHKNG